MQWYSPDLINESISNACLLELERILCSENTKTHTKYSHLHEKQKFEKLLVDIKSADYHSIEKCLQLIAEYSNETVQLIWKLFKQYSQANLDKCICGYCKIRKHVDIRDCSRYFWRQNIISDQLFENIILSNSDQASCDLLWNDLENEMNQHAISKHIKEALNATLETYFNTYADLSTEIEEWLCDPKTKFKCSCQELHLQLLKPADNETDSDTFTTDFNETETTDTKINRCNSKSSSGRCRLSFRRSDSKGRQIRSQSVTNAKDQREIVPKRSLSCETFSNPKCDSDTPINFDSNKATKIYNFKNINGPISVGNHIVRMGNHELSDTSNDSDGCLSNDSNMDLRISLKSNDLKSTCNQGTISANVSSCTSKMALPMNTIASVSEETATSSSVLKPDGAETFSGKNETYTSVALQKPSSTKANAFGTSVSDNGDQRDEQRADNTEEPHNQQKSSKDKSVDKTSVRTRYQDLDYSSDGRCVKERADVTKGKQNGQKAGTDKSIAGKFICKHSPRLDDVNALESTIFTRNTTPVKTTDTIKRNAEFTNELDHDTGDDDNESHSSEMPINIAPIISDEETAPASTSLHSNDSDVNTQRSVQEKSTQSTNKKMFEQKAAKTDNKHVKLKTSPDSDIIPEKASKQKQKSKRIRQSGDNNVETIANITEEKQTGVLNTWIIYRIKDSIGKSDKKKQSIANQPMKMVQKKELIEQGNYFTMIR